MWYDKFNMRKIQFNMIIKCYSLIQWTTIKKNKVENIGLVCLNYEHYQVNGQAQAYSNGTDQGELSPFES